MEVEVSEQNGGRAYKWHAVWKTRENRTINVTFVEKGVACGPSGQLGHSGSTSMHR